VGMGPIGVAHEPQPLGPGACPRAGVLGGAPPQDTETTWLALSASTGHQSFVGEGGFEPPRPYGHTDLNRARLPFRHSPVVTRGSLACLVGRGLHIPMFIGPGTDTIDQGARAGRRDPWVSASV
jgi:hypothetical protein